MIKTDSMKNLFRGLKKFYLDNSKRFYNLLKDYMLANVVQNQAEVKAKKEIFRYIDSD